MRRRRTWRVLNKLLVRIVAGLRRVRDLRLLPAKRPLRSSAELFDRQRRRLLHARRALRIQPDTDTPIISVGYGGSP